MASSEPRILLSSPYHTHEFANGLRLLVEPIKGVHSAAFTFLVPAGVIHDPPKSLGVSNLLSDLVTRGAGDRDSRAFQTALDNLGVQRHEATEIVHTSFTVATVADKLAPALTLCADMLRRPRLDAEQLDFCKASAIQELKALDDEPAQKLFIELRRRALPDPLGRPILGSLDHIVQLKAEAARGFHSRHYRPNGAILGIAGAVSFEEARDLVQRLLGDWEPIHSDAINVGRQIKGYEHLPADKIQTQIGIAFNAVSYGDPDYFNCHGAVGVLSGGMSSRLFTEVREKRGLCYGVGASFLALKESGLILCHASTNADRADQTLSVMLHELERLHEGISEDEVRRVRAGLKSSLIMQEESTSARASILARSWHLLGRVRTVREVAAEIEKLSPSGILEFLERHPPGEYAIVTLGPRPLETAA